MDSQGDLPRLRLVHRAHAVDLPARRADGRAVPPRAARRTLALVALRAEAGRELLAHPADRLVGVHDVRGDRHRDRVARDVPALWHLTS